MRRWHGHLPLASLALSSVLKRATHGGAHFSPAERALFTACEFWVAVEERALVAYFGTDAAHALRNLSIVYSAVGTPNVARALIRAVCDLTDATTPMGRVKCLTALQDRLLRTMDPVDRLIAVLANALGMGSEADSDQATAASQKLMSA